MLRRLLRGGGREGDRGFESRIVWIFGSPRSGSTWLLELLGEHEAVVPVNEPLIGWFLGPIVSDLPGVDPEGLRTGDFTLRRLQREKRSQFFSDEFRDAWLPGLGRLIRERLYAEAARYPPRAPLSRSLVAVKEPNGSQSADVLMEALPRSRMVFLLRDGRDVVDSELAASRAGSWVVGEGSGAFRGVPDSGRLDYVVGSAHKWLWRTEVTQAAFEVHDGPKHLVRYEDLRREPQAHMRALLDWLGLPMSDDELSALVERHAFERLPAEDTGPLKFRRAARPGLWRENLTAEEQTAVERIIGPKLRELGYGAAV